MAQPPTFRSQAAAEATSLADTPWWEVFEDPVLAGLIQEALRNNYDTRVAAARVQQASANLSVARSDFFPSLDYGATAGRTRIPLTFLGVGGGPEPRRPTSSPHDEHVWELESGANRRSNGPPATL